MKFVVSNELNNCQNADTFLELLKKNEDFSNYFSNILNQYDQQTNNLNCQLYQRWIDENDCTILRVNNKFEITFLFKDNTIKIIGCEDFK